MQVDEFGSRNAQAHNVAREYERNGERYGLLRWAQRAFRGVSVVPPATGIVHQVNLEYLAQVVQVRSDGGQPEIFPDTLVGMDSHTPMVNGLGVLGWGVGGIEAEAVLLGQPLILEAPRVLGVELRGALQPGVTATDLVLTVTELLRRHGVVGSFVEFFGAGLSGLAVPDRATLANMAPEYGATAALFPVDDQTLAYLRLTASPEGHVRLVERYAKEQGLFRTPEAPPPDRGTRYAWAAASTYVQEPPFFRGMSPEPAPLTDLSGARALVVLGDSVTTDAISPAGAIPADGPAGQYLIARGVVPAEFNTFGARRGNHEVMVRGTFGNPRLRNELAPGREGDWTRHLPTGETVRIFDAAERYRAAGTPLLVIAGKEYGTGSSRDWAAKGPLLLGVRAVLAESYERIHRSNLVGMGILPLQFEAGEGRRALGLDGTETYAVAGLAAGLAPRQRLAVTARREDGTIRAFTAVARLDTAADVEFLRQGGLLPALLRRFLRHS